jgi:hypothetical protein
MGRVFAIAAMLFAWTISYERLMAAPPSPDFAKAVTFIFLADAQGNLRMSPQTGGVVPNGTGFFVVVPNENGPGFYGYLVTAKHVLKDERGAFLSRVFIRINDKKGGSEFLAADLLPNGPNQNLFVHSDPTVDIAVIPAWPDEAKFEFRAVPMEMIKTKEEFKQTTIAPGSDVFFAGLFVPHVGDKVNTPIFRVWPGCNATGGSDSLANRSKQGTRICRAVSA